MSIALQEEVNVSYFDERAAGRFLFRLVNLKPEAVRLLVVREAGVVHRLINLNSIYRLVLRILIGVQLGRIKLLLFVEQIIREAGLANILLALVEME